MNKPVTRASAKHFLRGLPVAVAMAGMGAGSLMVGCGGAQEEQPKPQAAAKAPPKLIPGEQELKQARAAGEKGEWKQAAELYGQVAAICAQDPRREAEAKAAELNRGIALERATDLRGALEVYRKVLQENPQDEEAARRVARVLIALDESQEAQGVIEAALEHHPEHTELLNTLAGVLRRNGKLKEAADTARKVLLRDQKNATATKTLALVYADEGKLQLAETFFNNALKLNDKDASIHVNLGLIAYRRGEHQKAILSFEKALELDPNNAAAMANIGAIALKYRDYARAVDNYRKALDAGLSNCTTAAALGYSLEGMQAGPEAVEQLKKAYSMCPRDHDILYTVGMICLEQMRDNDCALQYFEKYTSTKEKLAKDHPVHRFIESIKQMKAMEQAPPEAGPEGEDHDEGGAPAEETAAEAGDANAPQSAGAKRLGADQAA